MVAQGVSPFDKLRALSLSKWHRIRGMTFILSHRGAHQDGAALPIKAKPYLAL